MNKGGFYIFLGFVGICVGALIVESKECAPGFLIMGISAIGIFRGFVVINLAEAAADTEKN